MCNFLPFIESNLKKYLIARCDTFAAGCIGHSLRARKEIISDKEILSTVMGMKIDFNKPPQHFLPTCTRPTSKEAVIDLEIKKHLLKHVIEPTRHNYGEIISDVFVHVKKDSGHRVILSLQNLNKYAHEPHFTMYTLNTIIKPVGKDCFMASIDLKDAYYSIPTPHCTGNTYSFFGGGNFISSHAYPMASHAAPESLPNPNNTVTSQGSYVKTLYRQPVLTGEDL